MRYIYYFAWAWIIVVGGLMITPGGVSCIKCGQFQPAIGIISILIGAIGLATTLRAPPQVAIR